PDRYSVRLERPKEVFNLPQAAFGVIQWRKAAKKAEAANVISAELRRIIVAQAREPPCRLNAGNPKERSRKRQYRYCDTVSVHFFNRFLRGQIPSRSVSRGGCFPDIIWRHIVMMNVDPTGRHWPTYYLSRADHSRSERGAPKQKASTIQSRPPFGECVLS